MKACHTTKHNSHNLRNSIQLKQFVRVYPRPKASLLARSEFIKHVKHMKHGGSFQNKYAWEEGQRFSVLDIGTTLAS